MLRGANAGTTWDACLALIELEIRAAYLSHLKAYKRPGSFNSQFTLTIHHLRPYPRLKLLCFLKTHKAPSFFQSFQRFSPCSWLQKWRLLLPLRALLLLSLKWVVFLLKKPLF